MSDEPKSETGGAPPPPAPGSPGPWLPPRLRDRLGQADEPPPPAENPLLGWLAMLVIAAMVGGLVYWKMQSTKAEKKQAEIKAAADRAAAVQDSLARLATLDSLRAVARADSAAAFLRLPAWKQAALRAGRDTAATATAKSEVAAAEETGRFAIDAGTFLFEDPANAAVASIKSAGVKLPIKVVPIESGGSTSYHVYVGDFKVKGEATYTANQLFEKGKLAQANVVKVE